VSILIEAVTHEYRERRAVTNVSFAVPRGVTALVGVNGAGKSTLLKIAGGALRPNSGRVIVDGSALYSRATRKTGLRDVALMPQTSRFPPSMTLTEVVEYVTWMRGSSMREARNRAQDALERVLLSDRANHKVRTLSGGMLRRLCLAQALSSGADNLLLDEPSTGLDPEQRRVMVERLAELEGTIVLSSHVMEDVVELATSVVILNEGAVVHHGDLASLRALAPDPAGTRAAEDGFLQLVATARAGEA